MTQMDVVYEYLKKKYAENEPIFLGNVSIKGMSNVAVRQQFAKLVKDGRLKRFDAGIYYFPRKSIFKSGSTLSADEVIRRMYLTDGEKRCGYLSGISFANRIGLTTQVPMTYEVCTNKATTEYRTVNLGRYRVILRKPYVEITEQNLEALQFLDLMREVMDISEMEGTELTERLIKYLKAKGIGFEMLKPYLKFYPDKIFKNMYEAGILNGVAT